MKKTIAGYFKGYSEDEDLVKFIASSGNVDREGEVIDPNGWDLSNVGKNLPLLWAHNDRALPIGQVVKAYVEENNLVAEVRFAHKVSEFAKLVFDLVKAKFLNAVSVGFLPKAFDTDGKMIQQELLELSVVNVPANQDAMRSEMYQAFCKSLNKLETKELEKKEEPKKPGGDEKNPVPVVAEPEEIEKKEGRVFSEKNRNSMRVAIDGMRQAVDSLTQLLNETEPPAKKGGVNINELPVKAREEKKRIYKAVVLMDKVVEALIHELKKGGEK